MSRRKWSVIGCTVMAIGILPFFLVDSMVKWSVERMGSRVRGMHVSVDDVDVEYFPLRVVFHRIHVAYSNASTVYALESDRSELSLLKAVQ